MPAAVKLNGKPMKFDALDDQVGFAGIELNPDDLLEIGLPHLSLLTLPELASV